MAKISGKFVITETFLSDRGTQYVTMADLTEGGTFKVGIPGASVEVKPGMMVQADLVVKPSIGKYGLNLTYLAGTFAKI